MNLQTPSWLLSMLVHMAAMILLAMLQTGWKPQSAPPIQCIVLQEPPTDFEPLLPDPVAVELPGGGDELMALAMERGREPDPPPCGVHRPLDEVIAATEGYISWTKDMPRSRYLDRPGVVGDGGRILSQRLRAFEQFQQSTPEGRAVAMALRWIAEHQLPDGGWSFEHSQAAKCRGQCRNSGKLDEARIAATALALLPMLGAGQTHRDGHYQKTVRDGLYFLTARMKVSPAGGALNEPGGRMYAHGLAAIALCEAFALTHDKPLVQPAQLSLNFIAASQDPVGGGWRYEPRQRGDTSVVGWQIMALKSGHLGYLRVSPATLRKAADYLDGVQSESGSRYGYTDAGQGSAATNAIGLLCRMHLGWQKDNPALQRGVEALGRQGPSPNDLYYDYYAAQVLRHWEGELWDEWFAAMKKQLLGAQATRGHEAGSWHVEHAHAERGGRLYCTAMAAMILEVNYRVLPLYQSKSVAEAFPL